MPNSKQKTKRKSKTAFYSRKYNKWFKNYKSYQTYNKIKRQNFYQQRAPLLKYNKTTGKVYDPISKRRFTPRTIKPRSAERKLFL